MSSAGVFYSHRTLDLVAWIFAGTHISNTREAKAFALLSEEGIAKGIRRVTAVTMDYAFSAMALAASLEKEVYEASDLEGSSLEQVLKYIGDSCMTIFCNSTFATEPMMAALAIIF